MDYKNKIAWVTGASSGIGLELSKLLLSKGCTVIASALKKEELEAEYVNHSDNLYLYPFDLGSAENVSAAANHIIEKFKRVDILINNGGISQRCLVGETTLDMDRLIMEVNYFSSVILTKAVLPIMLENGGGYIAATSSISGKFGFPYRSAYSAAKHATQGFFETLRAEYLSKGISVTVAYPGRISTNISKYALKKGGEFHGKMDPGQANGMSAKRCAEIYLKAIEKKKPAKLIGHKELLMVHIKRFFPRIFFKIVTKINPV